MFCQMWTCGHKKEDIAIAPESRQADTLEQISADCLIVVGLDGSDGLEVFDSEVADDEAEDLGRECGGNGEEALVT